MPSNPLLLAVTLQTSFSCTVCGQEKGIEELYNPNMSIGKFILCNACASVGKHCSMCGKYQLFNEYTPTPGSVNRGGVKAYCKPCNKEYSRKRHDPIKHRERMLLAQRGISVQQYEEMLTRQSGVCAICKQPETALDRKGNTKWLAVDHNHATGIRRELLCSRCNLLLGQIEKDKERIQAILLYIEKHQ